MRSCGVSTTPFCTLVTAIALAWLPSELKYSVWLAVSKWNSAPEPENWLSFRRFEGRRHVHAGRQPAAISAGGDGDVVVLGRVVEVGDDARTVGGVEEGERVVAAAAAHRMAAGIADQDVVAGAALQRFGAVGGDQDRIAASGAVNVVALVALLTMVAVAVLLVAIPSVDW